MTDFEKLYDAYFNDVYRYICRLSGDEQMADEITSETFFKAMHGIDRFRGDCDVRVWLCQIAKNCYYTYLKKSRKNRSVDLGTLRHMEDPTMGPEEQLIRREEAERIREIAEKMPEPYREVFMWRVFAQLSFRQIGSIFGKSENWACVTYHRARKRIKEEMEGSRR